MELGSHQFRIPTLAGLLLVILIVGGLTFFDSSRITSLVGRARTLPEGGLPKNTRISNLTDSSFVIGFATQETVPAEVHYTVDDTDFVAFDIRDRADSIPKPYRIHYFEITGLPPKTSSAYTIIIADNQTESGTITLAPPLPVMQSVLPVQGQLTIDGAALTQGTIIYATLGNSALWSTFVKNTPNWIIPISQIRTNDHTRWYCISFECPDDTILSLELFGEEGTYVHGLRLAHGRPAQPLTFSGILEEKVVEEEFVEVLTPTIMPIEIITPAVKSAQVPKISQTESEISILNPKKDALLSFPKPLIRGMGVPGEEVTITLDSEVTQVGKTIVHADGIWYWTPAYPLEEGTHTVHIKTHTSSGKEVTRSHSFQILKSGQQVLADSTPSASSTPASTPSASATPTGSTTSPTTAPPTPIIVSPTALPTITPSPTPSPPFVMTLTPTPTLYIAGGYAPSVMVLAAGAVLLMVAFVVL